MSTTRTRQAGNDPGHHRRDVESDGGRRAGGRVGSPQAPPGSVSVTKQLQANPQIHFPRRPRRSSSPRSGACVTLTGLLGRVLTSVRQPRRLGGGGGGEHHRVRAR